MSFKGKTAYFNFSGAWCAPSEQKFPVSPSALHQKLTLNLDNLKKKKNWLITTFS